MEIDGAPGVGRRGDLELKRPARSASEAPLAKVIFTTAMMAAYERCYLGRFGAVYAGRTGTGTWSASILALTWA
jgi:hypothetical protein